VLICASTSGVIGQQQRRSSASLTLFQRQLGTCGAENQKKERPRNARGWRYAQVPNRQFAFRGRSVHFSRFRYRGVRRSAWIVIFLGIEFQHTPCCKLVCISAKRSFPLLPSHLLPTIKDCSAVIDARRHRHRRARKRPQTVRQDAFSFVKRSAAIPRTTSAEPFSGHWHS